MCIRRPAAILAIVACIPLVHAGTLTVAPQPQPPGITILSAGTSAPMSALANMLILVEMGGSVHGATYGPAGDPSPTVVWWDVPGLLHISSGGPGQFRFGTLSGTPLKAVVFFAYTAGLAFDMCCFEQGNDIELTPGSSYGWPAAYAAPAYFPDGTAYYREPMVLGGLHYGDLFGVLRLEFAGDGYTGAGWGSESDIDMDIDSVEIVPEPATWSLMATALALTAMLRRRPR